MAPLMRQHGFHGVEITGRSSDLGRADADDRTFLRYVQPWNWRRRGVEGIFGGATAHSTMEGVDPVALVMAFKISQLVYGPGP